MAEHGVTFELFYGSAWHPAPVYTRAGLTFRRGVPNPGDSDPALAPLTLDNRSGLYAPRSVASALYGRIGQNTPGRITVDGDVRMVGEVVSWKPGRNENGSDAWTEVELAGVLQRIGRGTDPLHSALHRTIAGVTADDYTVHAYWPLEGGGTGAYTANTQAAVVTGSVSLSGYTGAAGSEAVPILSDGGTISGVVPTTTLAATGAGDRIVQVQFMGMVPSTLSADATFLDIDVPATGGADITLLRVTWQHSSARLQLRWYAVSGAVVGFVQLDLTGLFDIPLLFAISVFTDVVGAPGSITGSFSAWPDGSGFPAAFDFSTWTAPAVPVPTAWRATATAGNAGWALGHLAFYTDPTVLAGPNVQDNARALDGYVGETAADRFVRVCREEDIAATVVGDPAVSVPMGPQLPAALLDMLDEMARTDDASIFETRDATSLTMRTGASRLNQSPAFTISYLGEVRPALTPVYGDAGIRNDVTAASPRGATRRVQQLTGPHNVQAPSADPQGVGRYKTRIDVNPSTDDALADAAGWRVNVGTYDGVWYAEVTADLDAAPSITAAVAALDIGDVLAISSLPVDEALDTVECLIIGIKEDVPAKRRTITFYCIPAAPYRVGILAATTGDTDPIVGRLETDGSTVVAAVNPAEIFSDGFEAGTGAWSAMNGWALVPSATHVRAGVSAMRLTPPGAVASGGAILTGRTPATAGVTYVAEVWFFSVAGWADARIAVDWRNAADGVISTSLGSATVVPAGVWTVSRQVFTAPALTASAQPRVRQGGTPAVGDVLWADDASFGPQLNLATPSGPLWTTAPDDFPLDLVVGGQLVSVLAITGASSPQTVTVNMGELPAYPIPAGSAVTVAQPIILAL